MPSPLAHVAAACLTGGAVRSRTKAPTWRVLFTALVFSLLPDLDVIPGWLAGDMSRFHNQITHSFVFGALCSLAALPFLKRWIADLSVPRLIVLTFGAYSLHLVMDFATYGRGLMLAWPFTAHRYQSPWIVFRGLRWSEGWYSTEHLLTLANEGAVIAVCIIFLAFFVCLYRGRKNRSVHPRHGNKGSPARGSSR